MSFKLEDFLITGRTFGEYMAFFNLKTSELDGCKVLDCPSGASSFIAEAKAKGIDAKGVDILYQYEREDIKSQGVKSIEMIYQNQDVFDKANMSFYGSVANHRRFREEALRQFSEDYNRQDYLFAQLPRLPFEDESFDMLLSSHLLFVYDDRLDYDFHQNSIKEMLRVSREVRIFPLVDYNNTRVDEEENFSPYVYQIVQKFGGEIIKVDFEFQKGANYMLRIIRGQ